MTSVAAAALQGLAPLQERLERDTDQAAFLEVVDRDGVGPLLRRNLKAQGMWDCIPDGVKTALDERAHAESALEALRFRETKRVLAGLREARVENLVLKGAALAYTHYPAGYLRPRVDTDVLIRLRDRSFATEVLGTLGYQRANSVSRDAVHTQWTFKRSEGPVPFAIDLHWALSNRPLFANMLSFDELLADAKSIVPLGEAALTSAPVHALLHACIHRIAQHDDSPDLLWLYDIKLLAEGLSPTDWQRFWELAARKQISELCTRNLARTAAQVGCRQTLDSRPAGIGKAEPSAAYLGGVGTGLRSLVLDLKGSPGAAAKVRLLAGHAFPTPAYMRNAYGATGQIGLAAAYVRRATRGLRQLITSSASASNNARAH